MNFRNVPASVLSLDELITEVAFLDLLSDRIHDNGFDIPDSVKNRKRDCQRELDEKLRGDRELRLRKLEAQREALLTSAERRKKVEAEIADLKGQLGVSKKAGK